MAAPTDALPPGGLIVLVDKTEGPTSHDVVARARRAFRTRRVGHTGTLDPFATGLLVLCIGESTRLSQYLTGQDKSYVATAELGVATDTLDLDGEVVSTSDGAESLTLEQIESALEPLRGAVLQRPPRFSAKKVGGKAAHRLAREGQEVELDPVPVTVHELAVVEFAPPRLVLTIRCSSGTYIRALARDLGEALGVGAHLTALRRTAVGKFSVDDALDGAILLERDVDAASDERFAPPALLTPLQAMHDLVPAELGPSEMEDILQGRQVPVSDDRLLGALREAAEAAAARASAAGAADAAKQTDGKPRPLAAAHVDGHLVALCALVEDRLRPVKVFPSVVEALQA